MPKLTKIPENCPVDVAINAIAAFHPDELTSVHPYVLCTKIILVGGNEIWVKETMEDIRMRLPNII